MPDFPPVPPPTVDYDAIASAVWAYSTRTLAGFTGTPRSDLVGADEPIYTRLDVAVSSRSSHSAADVWAVATRTLTPHPFPFTNPPEPVDLTNVTVSTTVGEVLAPSYGDIKVYPWAGSGVLDADPTYSYTDEVSQSGTEWAEVGYFDFDEDLAEIKSIFVNLVWAMKVTGAGSGKAKWQIAPGTHDSPTGPYVDITDEVTETSTEYSDHGRSGVIHRITGVPSQTPFTIRLVIANVDATSVEAKIKSNSYIRVTYRRVSA